MNKYFLRNLQISLAALDLLVLNIVFFVFGFLFREELFSTAIVEYYYFGFFLSLAWLTVSLIANIYNSENVMSFDLFTRKSMYAFVYFLIPVSFYLFFFGQFEISRWFISLVLVFIPVGLLFNRFIYLCVYHYFKKKDYLTNKVVVLGYNDLSKRLVTYLEEAGINKKVVGYCDNPEKIHELSLHPILGSIDDALDICKEHGATEIFSTIAPEQYPGIYQLMHKADESCIRVKIIPDINFVVNRQVHLDFLKEIPVLSLRNEPLEDLGNRIKKRIFDVVVSSFVIVFILSWLMPLIGILIWLEARGPILFVQPRSGRDNMPFPCLKFRSMRVNALSDEKQATKNDSRITKIGKFLRRSSLDEFPQFINVFKGEMSVVGPRPHMLKHTDEYSRIVNQYMVRQFLKPGITGWAQVNGFRGETKVVEQMQKRVEHDLWYMENWNSWIDLRIIFLTVFNTLRGEENAY